MWTLQPTEECSQRRLVPGVDAGPACYALEPVPDDGEHDGLFDDFVALLLCCVRRSNTPRDFIHDSWKTMMKVCDDVTVETMLKYSRQITVTPTIASGDRLAWNLMGYSPPWVSFARFGMLEEMFEVEMALDDDDVFMPCDATARGTYWTTTNNFYSDCIALQDCKLMWYETGVNNPFCFAETFRFAETMAFGYNNNAFIVPCPDVEFRGIHCILIDLDYKTDDKFTSGTETDRFDYALVTRVEQRRLIANRLLASVFQKHWTVTKQTRAALCCNKDQAASPPVDDKWYDLVCDHDFRTIYVCSLIGSGAYGQVFKGVDVSTDTNKSVAIKKMDARTKSNMDEVKWMRLLDHPNIMKVEVAFVRGDYIFMVTELAECDLDHLIYHRHPGSCYTPSIGAQLFSALVHIHSREIVHADIKPKNVLVDTDSVLVRLADFGMASKVGGTVGLYFFTRAYRPPEVVCGCSVARPSQDIWAAGVTLAEFAKKSYLFEPAWVDPTRTLSRMSSLIGTPPDRFFAETFGVNEGAAFMDESVQPLSWSSILGTTELNETVFNQTVRWVPNERSSAADVCLLF